jgi:hypothetical protein
MKTFLLQKIHYDFHTRELLGDLQNMNNLAYKHTSWFYSAKIKIVYFKGGRGGG